MNIHIPLGRRVRDIIEGYIGHATVFSAVIFALVTFAMALTCFAPPVEAAELPKMLVSAQSSDQVLATDFYASLSPNATTSATLQTESCTGYHPILNPGDALVVRDFTWSRMVCRSFPNFALLAAPDNVDAYTVVTYNSNSSHWSFKVPPIGAIDVDHPAVITPVVNDDVDQTLVNVFPTQPTTIYFKLGAAAEESYLANPPFAQIHLSAHGSGTLVVSIRKPPCYVGADNPACAAPPPLYGLVTVGRKNSASLDARPF